jgi:hypothetical protein
MSDTKKVNDRGNYDGQFSQGIGGWAEFKVYMTDSGDEIRYDLKAPPSKVIPVIFIPGVMGSNLRMSKARQSKLETSDNRAWRPDDLTSSPVSTGLLKQGMGGWFRKASPAQRQLIFDPNETEVEYYHYTSNNGKFDPEGKDTLAADARHQNVPDNLVAIPPLMMNESMRYGKRDPNRKLATAAQLARWRGWSEVMFDGAYGTMLTRSEAYLNNITENRIFDPLGIWRTQDGSIFNKNSGISLTEKELLKISRCWYPVHAMGYNFLKSNAESAKVIADRLRGLVSGYENCGFVCKEVIVVTHSMGGLVARALVHPQYGNMLNDPKVKILGIYHSAMPTLGAAASYKRMRFGFLEKDDFKSKIFGEIVGIDGENATAILANTPAPLEMLPSRGYGNNWLKVVDGFNRTLFSWPGASESATESIYLMPANNWWRLINPEWVNPANAKASDGAGLANVKKRLISANIFLDSIEKTFHPTQSYASYCASDEHKSFGNIVFKIVNANVRDLQNISLPSADTWTLLTDDKKGTLTVQAGARILTLKLQAGDASGDETVPSDRSASKIVGTIFKHGVAKGTGYEHQGSYSDPHVLASLLYSIVKIAGTAKWD